MKADSTSLLNFLAQPKMIFEIPVYQRNYEWGEGQCKKLFQDLINLTHRDQEHFLGTIVYASESGKMMSYIDRIIDGQQRLTSCMLLLKALADSDNLISVEITEQYLQNKFLDENKHLKLLSVERDRKAYHSVMLRNTDYTFPSKIVENYKLFRKYIEDSGFQGQELLQAMSRFNVVYIELDSEVRGENPQVIFESLNSTGVSLSPSDLIRNFILMGLKSHQQEQLYREYWLKIENVLTNNIFTEFIRHYLIMKTHTLVNKNAVYERYKEYYNDAGFTAEESLRDLYRFSNYYSELLEAKTDSADLNRLIGHINTMGEKAVYPYLLKLLMLKDDGGLQLNEIIDVTKIWESYILRRLLCGIRSSGMNRMIVALVNVDHSTPEIQQVEKRLLSNDYPNDKQVKEALKVQDLYHRRKELAKLSLVILEENRTREIIDFEDAQVEHIMPQKLSDDWRIEVANADSVNQKFGGVLGNLTLTKYNQEMSNKLFEQKHLYYQQSNISLTREISDHFNEWDKDSIIARNDALSEELVSVLPRPNDVQRIVKANYEGEHDLSEMIDLSGQKPIRITIDGEDFGVDSWKKMMISFLNYAWNFESDSFGKLRENSSLGKILFGTDGRAIRSSAVLNNGEIVETNFSSNNIMAILKKIAELYGIIDDVKYTLK